MNFTTNPILEIIHIGEGIKMGKILNSWAKICLFCGEEIQRRYEDHHEYYECECADAKRDREITEEIRHLVNSRPDEKFIIEQQRVLYKNKS